MNVEIDALERNNTWELIDFPKNKNCIAIKWIYKTKLNNEVKDEKHKERLVSHVFSEQPSIDYNDPVNFALIAYDLVSFDDVVKKEFWVEYMNEEIDTI